MAVIRKLASRIVSKHDTAEFWNVSDFIPLQGEIIIYDPGYDSVDNKTYTRSRMKVGDGVRTVQELPFVVEVESKVTKHAASSTVLTDAPAPVYTPAQYTAPSISHTYEDEVLKIQFNEGTYIPAVFTVNPVSSTTIDYVTDVDVSVEVQV